MNKSMRVGVVGAVLMCGIVGLGPTGNPVVAAEPGIEMLARRSRPSGRRSGTPSRTYRSYSVEPGIGGDGAAVTAPSSQPRSSGYGGGSRSSKPSYMRGDSKARGRFHQ